MRPILLVLVLLLASPCAAADWEFMRSDQLAQAPPAVVSAAPLCPCGESCQCSNNSKELASLRRYRDRMEVWIAENGYRNPDLYTKQVSAQVLSPAEAVMTLYEEKPVCIDGKCYLPSKTYAPRQSYTGGRYTNWLPRGGRFFGGSCANGQCQ